MLCLRKPEGRIVGTIQPRAGGGWRMIRRKLSLPRASVRLKRPSGPGADALAGLVERAPTPGIGAAVHP